MLSFLQLSRRAPKSSAWRVLFWWGIMVWTLRVSLYVLYRFRYRGRNNIPKSGPILFVANHQSNFDPAIVGVVARDRPFHGIARDTLFDSKLLSAYMRGFGVISIKRGEADMVAIRKAITQLAAGRCVMMFPEGTRTKDGELGQFQRGFWLLMKKSKATVLPIGIDGAFGAYPIGLKPKLRGYIESSAGEPIEAETLLEMGEEEGTKYIRSRLELLIMECRENIRNRSK